MISSTPKTAAERATVPARRVRSSWDCAWVRIEEGSARESVCCRPEVGEVDEAAGFAVGAEWLGEYEDLRFCQRSEGVEGGKTQSVPWISVLPLGIRSSARMIFLKLWIVLNYL